MNIGLFLSIIILSFFLTLLAIDSFKQKPSTYLNEIESKILAEQLYRSQYHDNFEMSLEVPKYGKASGLYKGDEVEL